MYFDVSYFYFKSKLERLIVVAIFTTGGFHIIFLFALILGWSVIFIWIYGAVKIFSSPSFQEYSRFLFGNE
jgi:hypothetical protein